MGLMLGGGLNYGGAPNVQGADYGYAQSYKNALQQNQQVYGNVLGGYQQLMNNQQDVQKGIQSGYGQLSSDVLGSIQGIDQSQRQAISDAYAQQSGQAGQSLTSRGLGNSTVVDSVQRGLGFDQAKANVALTNQTQQLTAGYMSQLGLAGLGYAQQAQQENAALGSQQLGFMGSFREQLPDAQGYAQLAQKQQQFQASQQQQQSQFGQSLAEQYAAMPGNQLAVQQQSMSPYNLLARQQSARAATRAPGWSSPL